MSKPPGTPIGLQLALTAKNVSRAFGQALSAAGGSLPTWIVLLSVKSGRTANQRELAEAAGIRSATLTHHLNSLERAGLLSRRRDSENRRIHVVELTETGEALFQRLRSAAAAFDRRLRSGISDHDIASVARALEHLDRNADETLSE